jgi:hypothetical protein
MKRRINSVLNYAFDEEKELTLATFRLDTALEIANSFGDDPLL